MLKLVVSIDPQARLMTSLDKNIDKFELYVVRNCLCVPGHIDDSSAQAIAVGASLTSSRLCARDRTRTSGVHLRT